MQSSGLSKLRLEQLLRLEQFRLLCLYSPCKSLSSIKKKKKQKTTLIFHRCFFPKCFELHLTSKVGRSSPGEGRHEYSLQSEELQSCRCTSYTITYPKFVSSGEGKELYLMSVRSLNLTKKQ